MIVQWSRRVVPGHEVNGAPVSVRRAIVRHPHFAITVLRSNGLATDWGMQGELVRFIARMTRTQLSILLEGRGYFGPAPLFLTPGDVVWSDQRLAEAEGYAGAPCEVLVVEWDHDALFGPEHRGEAQRGHIAPRDVARLRALVARLPMTPAAPWSIELAATLAALGLRTATEFEAHDPASRHVQLFAELGNALSRLDAQPSLGEIADTLAVTERQAHRRFKELEDAYGARHEGWRDFIGDARLGWATQLLSVPGLPLSRVAALAGYGSTIALSHAFALRARGGDASTPGVVARRLADRWDLGSATPAAKNRARRRA